jgi:putative sigma-54 modulation protein
MHLTIHGKQIDISDNMRKLAERRLRTALSRFDERLVEVRMTLNDANGPRGGRDKHAHVEVKVRGMPPINIEENDTSFAVAITRSATRIGQAVARALERQSNKRIDYAQSRGSKRRISNVT